MDGAVTKERQSQTSIESLREKLLSVRSHVDRYCQRLPLYTERFTAGVTNGFSDFLFSLTTEDKKLVEKQRKDTGSPVKTDVEAMDVLLPSVTCKLRRPEPSSLCFRQ